jgi:predicted amidophosphoribosyltransferase
VRNVDMSAGSHVEATTAATNTQAARTLCGQCGAEVGASKFCPDCGKPVAKAIPEHCPKCNAETHGHKFCGNCGNKLTD